MIPPNSGLLLEAEAQEAEVQAEALVARPALAIQLMDLCSALETALHKPILLVI